MEIKTCYQKKKGGERVGLKAGLLPVRSAVNKMESSTAGVSETITEVFNQTILVPQCYFGPFKVRMWKGTFEATRT